MIRPRTKLRRGEPSKAEKQAARVFARDRASGMCQLRVSPQCTGRRVLPLDGDLLERGHLHHERSKRRFGWMEGPNQRHLFVCAWCHSWEHNGGKPCPRRPEL
jgi:hypothetical protein